MPGDGGLMRFAELELLRYGRFEGCHLRFPKGQLDLQIMFGPNEAGKSTTMAAISDLLFGFPHVTPYDFRFDRQLLRVGARLQDDGADVVCRRKKGRTGTLLDGQDRVLEEGVLKGMLAGYSAESFQRMFSLDHARLRRGGRAILDATDDVGQAIFAAGSGLVGIAGLLDGLEAQSREIWTSRRNGDRRYHAAQQRHEEARSRQKAAQLRPAAWDALRQDLVRLDAALAELRRRRGLHEHEREAVERRRRVLPPAASYRRVQAELAPLAGVPDLPADAAAILDQVAIGLAAADAEAALATAECDQLRASLDALIVDPRLIAQGEAIEALRETKGAADKSLGDLPRRRADLTLRVRRLAALQAELGWPEEAASALRERLPQRVCLAELRGLLEQRGALDATVSGLAADQAMAHRALERLHARLAELPAARDLGMLSAALRSARGLGDLDAAIRDARREAGRRARALSTSLAQLAPWTGAADALGRIVLPSDGETAAALDGSASAEAADAQRDHQAELDRRGELELRRTQLVRDAAAVPPERLRDARDARDLAWRELRAGLLDEAVLSDPVAAADAFERRSGLADAVADQRYAGARQSARITALQEELERNALLLAQHAKRLAEAQAAVQAQSLAWSRVLAPSGLRMQPRAFGAWSDRHRRALQAADEVERAEAASLEMQQHRDAAVAQLAEALAATGAPPASGQCFGLLLQAAERVEFTEAEAARQRRDLGTEIASAEDALRRMEAKQAVARAGEADWQAHWMRAVAAAGLDAGWSHSVIRAQLELIEVMRGELDEVLGLEQRIVTMQADIVAFDAEVATLAVACARSIDGRSSGELLAALAGAAREAMAARDRQAAMASRLVAAEGRLADAGAARARALARLRPLSEAAGEARTDLAGAVRRADRARSLRHDLDRLAEEVLTAGAGPSLQTLLDQSRESGEEDGATALMVRSNALQETLTHLSDEIARITGERAAVHAEATRFDDGPNAAIAASDAEQARAEMAVQAEAYARKRAEVALLRWTVARYRAEKQTPLLKRASTLFSRLTLGRYVELLVDLDGDKARLAVLDQRQAMMPVEGMSEGTVDQLFLALRLAAVEDTVAAGARLPFLADDLFINYDDERARAGFEVLAELARSTQVLFFTHHRHLVDVAEAALAPLSLSKCMLT